MTTVVTIMDRAGFDQRTDNIVIVDPRRRRLLWVPRDVWCPAINDRINGAFCLGGHAQLIDALGSLGFEVDHSVCVPRGAVERLLEPVSVTVRVDHPLRFWYPLTPTTNIQDARKEVDFDPPREVLAGERIHQWLGARKGRDPKTRGTDLERIRRQQVFLRALLRQGVDLSMLTTDREPPSWSNADAARREVAKVRWWWSMRCADQVADLEVDALAVLRLLTPEPRPPRWRRALRRLAPDRN